MAVSKVIYYDKVLIDITDSTVTPETLLEGVVAYNAKGERIVGRMKPGSSPGSGSTVTVTDDGNGNVVIDGVIITDDDNGNVAIIGLKATEDEGNVTIGG